MYEYWSQLFDREPAGEVAIRNELLWGNKFLRGRVKKKYEQFCKANGIHKINDLLAFGVIMSDQQFINKYGILPLPGLLPNFRRLLPHHWLQAFSPTDFHLSANSLYVRNEKGEWVDIQLSSAKQIYAIFEGKKTKGYTCCERWLKAYDEDDAFNSKEEWKRWFLLPYQLSHKVQLKSFTFKILYRIIPSRVYLYRVKVVASECCSTCAGRNDLFHFFFECPPVHSFGNSLATWMGGG